MYWGIVVETSEGIIQMDLHLKTPISDTYKTSSKMYIYIYFLYISSNIYTLYIRGNVIVF